MRFKLWVAAGLAAALVGCQGPEAADGGGEESSGGAEKMEIADFFIAAETSYCEWAARCGAYATADDCLAVQFFDITYPDGLLASGQLQQGGGAVVKYLLQSHEAGRIEFDADAAEQCLAYVEARGCDRPYTYAPSEEELAGRAACGEVFRGTMTRNGPCVLAMECAHEDGERATCGYDPTCTDACCVGGCRVLGAAEGEACNPIGGCQSGLFCATDPNTFLPTVCTKLLPLGAACFDGNACAAGGTCWNGVCRAPAKAGESCVDAPCDADSYCADPQQIGDYRCLGYGDVGDPCVYQDGCRPLRTACDYDWNIGKGQCVELPVAGEPCLENGQACAPSAYCDFTSYKCVARADAGAACGLLGGGEKYVECAGALRCDEGGSSVCEPPSVSGTCAVPELMPLPGEG